MAKYYVSVNGCRNAHGTKTDPLSLSSAFSGSWQCLRQGGRHGEVETMQIEAGDEIVLLGGTYKVPVDTGLHVGLMGTPDNYVKVYALPSDKVIIDGTDYLLQRSRAPWPKQGRKPTDAVLIFGEQTACGYLEVSNIDIIVRPKNRNLCLHKEDSYEGKLLTKRSRFGVYDEDLKGKLLDTKKRNSAPWGTGISLETRVVGLRLINIKVFNVIGTAFPIFQNADGIEMLGCWAVHCGYHNLPSAELLDYHRVAGMSDDDVIRLMESRLEEGKFETFGNGSYNHTAVLRDELFDKANPRFFIFCRFIENAGTNFHAWSANSGAPTDTVCAGAVCLNAGTLFKIQHKQRGLIDNADINFEFKADEHITQRNHLLHSFVMHTRKGRGGGVVLGYTNKQYNRQLSVKGTVIVAQEKQCFSARQIYESLFSDNSLFAMGIVEQWIQVDNNPSDLRPEFKPLVDSRNSLDTLNINSNSYYNCQDYPPTFSFRNQDGLILNSDEHPTRQQLRGVGEVQRLLRKEHGSSITGKSVFTSISKVMAELPSMSQVVVIDTALRYANVPIDLNVTELRLQHGDTVRMTNLHNPKISFITKVEYGYISIPPNEYTVLQPAGFNVEEMTENAMLEEEYRMYQIEFVPPSLEVIKHGSVMRLRMSGLSKFVFDTNRGIICEPQADIAPLSCWDIAWQTPDKRRGLDTREIEFTVPGTYTARVAVAKGVYKLVGLHI